MYSKKRLRVLIIEDCEDDKDLVLSALGRAFGHIVHERVESAGELRAALQRCWDVVICDHNMPALDALSALRIVQEYRCEAPFIVVSGSMADEAVVTAMTAGAADMISKNQLSRLVPAVKRELHKWSTICRLREVHEQLSHLISYDRPTKLPNREFLAKHVQRLIAEPAIVDGLVFMVVNLSRFSLIPRSLGMEAAELTLRMAGERLRNSIGNAGIVASLGGDRFAVLLTAPNAEAAHMVRRMNEEVARPLNIAGQELFLAQRIGISIYPDDGRDFQQLIAHAEIAMNKVSSGSHCNFRYFDQGMHADGQERLALEHALHRAFKRNEFVLHYQPQYDVLNERIVGVEALLRWHAPDGRAVSPAEFIPVLEENGLIVPVGEWVLRTACLQNLRWQQAGYSPIRVAVNLSAVQFRQEEFVPMVQRVLDETGLDRRCLELEITENIAMHNEEMVISTLTELSDMGVSLAVDDFGTGYSSLSYLSRFPIHKLKIDRSFIHDIDGSASGSLIVNAIVSLAKNLGLSVVAEGVETKRQEAFLLSCGCSEMQGFLYSPPAAHDAIERMFRRDAGGVKPAGLIAARP